MFLKFFFLLILQETVLSISREMFRCGELFSCENITCEKIKDCPGGRIVPKATYCNCCDKCVYKKDISSTRCREEREIREGKKITNSFISDDLWKPDCDENGNYALKQVKKVKSICMSHNGEKLFGQSRSELSENVTCGCSQYINNLLKEQKDSFMTQPQERCTASGDFERIQCIGKLCYCANPVTGAVESKLVRMDHLNKLACCDGYFKCLATFEVNKRVPDKESPISSYLKPCEKELIRARSLRYEFSLKGLEVIGLDKVQCDPDGTFSPRQCDTSRCSCTNEKGIQIRSYYTDDPKFGRQMSCSCARDNEKTQYPTLKCNSLGNYFNTQCFGDDRCFCVDEDGDIISKQLNTTEADSICGDLSRELNNLSKA